MYLPQNAVNKSRNANKELLLLEFCKLPLNPVGHNRKHYSLGAILPQKTEKCNESVFLYQCENGFWNTSLHLGFHNSGQYKES